MSITVYTYNDKVLKNAANNKWLKKYVDPYNPLGLPALTIRIKLSSGSSAPSVGGATVTAVQGQTDVYDICTAGIRGDSWDGLVAGLSITEVLGANTTEVTSMGSLFTSCRLITTVPLFDTSNVDYMSNMFAGCSALTSVPLFDTSNVNYMSGMFTDCVNVQSGALALYQQVSTQTTPPEYHEDCFKNCGSNTTTGAAELAQIPSSWGGTGA